MPAPLETSSPLQREPVAESVLIQRIGNRCDKGDLRDGAQEILELMRVKLRERHHSYRTEDTYLDWARRFLIFCGASSVDELFSEDVKAYLEFLAVKRKVSAATQNQAFNALLFLFSQTLGRSFGLIEGVTRAQARRRLPVVLRREEVKRLIAAMPDDYRLMTILLYGSGLRLMECLRLRIKDVDLEGRAIPP